MKSDKFRIGFFWGSLIGATAILLYAPDKGSVLRRSLAFQIEKRLKKIEQTINEKFNPPKIITSEAKTRGKSIVQKSLKRTSELRQEVDKMIGAL